MTSRSGTYGRFLAPPLVERVERAAVPGVRAGAVGTAAVAPLLASGLDQALPRASMPYSGISSLERLEMELLLEAVFRHYGYDFRHYAPSSLRRRLMKRLEAEGLATFSALQDRVLHDP